tara:strand:- start:216 stop:590 length:375 start_codon:yes stop_codon:yes gene_type:complete
MVNLKKMKDITKNVYWERNTKTRSNANIVGQVIPKTTTDSFPHDAVTVRYDRITSKSPSVGVYFYGATKANTNYGWNYADGKLIVYMSPDANGGYNLSFNGYTKRSLREITDYCEYIQSEMENM